MSKEVAVNVYSLMDKELERMHELLRTYILHPQEHQQAPSSRSHQSQQSNIPLLWKRILEMQELVMTEFKGHDKAIQQAVAEVAFTSTDSK